MDSDAKLVEIASLNHEVAKNWFLQVGRDFLALRLVNRAGAFKGCHLP